MDGKATFTTEMSMVVSRAARYSTGWWAFNQAIW